MEETKSKRETRLIETYSLTKNEDTLTQAIRNLVQPVKATNEKPKTYSLKQKETQYNQQRWQREPKITNAGEKPGGSSRKW